MYTSRLCFHTLPGKTHFVEDELKLLSQLVEGAGGTAPRVLRTHFASLGSPDVVFEQDAEDLSALESQIQQVTSSAEFKAWSEKLSGLLREPPKREVYKLTGR
jgi:hypothetical protein